MPIKTSILSALAAFVTASAAVSAIARPGASRFDVVGRDGVETSIVEMPARRSSSVLVLVTSSDALERRYALDREVSAMRRCAVRILCYVALPKPRDFQP